MMAHQHRTVTSMEFLTADGVRLELDADGWRLVKPRLMGEAQLARARDLVERIEACVPPQEPDAKPPTIEELGTYVAGQFNLRLNHRYFRHGR